MFDKIYWFYLSFLKNCSAMRIIGRSLTTIFFILRLHQLKKFNLNISHSLYKRSLKIISVNIKLFRKVKRSIVCEEFKLKIDIQIL